jgi:hypothetical protein
MLAEEGGIEMIVMKMGQVQIVRVSDGVDVNAFVAREGKPRTEVRRVEPGVAEDTPVAGLDEQAGVAQER